jgi:putative membrane protein insertion efficiency factor
LIISKAFKYFSVVLSYVLKGMITVYKYVISPLLGPKCRYLPTCSSYAMEAIDIHGPLKGTWLGARRILRCHPWGDCGYDPVPVKNKPEECNCHAELSSKN